MRNSRLLIFVLALALPASFAQADADLCEGVTGTNDLSTQMPPVEDQGLSPWCATFSAKAVLDFSVHASCVKNSGDSSCKYSDANEISPSDINSLSLSNPESLRGKSFTLSDGDATVSLLEGVQKAGAATQAEWPFNQTLFLDQPKDIPLLAKLNGFYSDERDVYGPTAKNSSPDRCKQPRPFADLLKNYSDIREVADQALAANPNDPDKARGQYLDELAQKHFPAPEGLIRKPIAPPFNITSVSYLNDKQFIGHIVDSLKKSEPLATDVCVYQLEANAGMKDNHGPHSDSCGAHGMTIVGVRRAENGKCQIHIRNSWGEGWPAGGPEKGYAWIDYDAYLGSLDHHDFTTSDGKISKNIPSLVSIETRTPGSPIQNTIVTENLVATGQTAGLNLEGPGRQESVTPQGKTIETGQFKAGYLVSGERRLGDGTVMTGSYDSTGNLTGEGTSTLANGTVLKGTFAAGFFVHGVQKFSTGQVSTGNFDANGALNGVGSITLANGQTQEGTFANNKLTDGKMTLASGQVLEGKFDNGRLTQGIYRFAKGDGPTGLFSGTLGPTGTFTSGWAKNMPGITVGGEGGYFFTGKLDDGKMKCGLAKKGSKSYCFTDSGSAFSSDAGTYASCHCDAIPDSVR